jgi:hypothetical protein
LPIRAHYRELHVPPARALLSVSRITRLGAQRPSRECRRSTTCHGHRRSPVSPHFRVPTWYADCSSPLADYLRFLGHSYFQPESKDCDPMPCYQAWA